MQTETKYKPFYSISTLGNCPRVLSAYRLRYKASPPSKRVELAADEGKLHEEHIVQKLREEGLILERAGQCLQCEKLGYDRKGIHLEWTFSSFRLTGHLDALVIGDKDGKYFPELSPSTFTKMEYPVCEIKTRSQSEYDRWLRERWVGFIDNAFQLTTYMTINKLIYDNKNKVVIDPMYYTRIDEIGKTLKSFFVVKNRNTGETTKSVQIGTPVKFTDVLTKLHNIEFYVGRGELYPEPPNWGSPRCSDWCLFKHLCILDTKQEIQQYIASEEFTKYSKMWLDGTTAVNSGQLMVDEAEAKLKGFAKSQSKDGAETFSFTTGLVKVTGYPVKAYVRPASNISAGWRCIVSPETATEKPNNKEQK